MLGNLSEKFNLALKKISGQGRISEKNIKDTLREIRIALLEADVALPVVKSFINKIQQEAIGTEVQAGLNPGEVFTKKIHDGLVDLLGNHQQNINLKTKPPAVILLAGLQGAGKTTTAAKLALFLKNQHKKKVMLASCDIYRPAAIEQLEILSKKASVLFCPTEPKQTPEKISKNAISHAKRNYADVLIIDTAGRTHIDDAMMKEISAIEEVSKPIETFFVIDSMSGQDALMVAESFHKSVSLSGIILTKTEADTRGGVALSVKSVINVPIKFIGTGEGISSFESFNPTSFADRILGKGDIISLVSKIEQNIDKQEILKQAKKLKKGKIFDLNDLKQQMIQMDKMGGIEALMDKLPTGMKIPAKIKNQNIASTSKKTIAIIDSMTKKERRFPALIKATRKKRIAAGSGNLVQDVNRLLKQHMQMGKMMKKYKGKNPSQLKMPFNSMFS
jgi:signal recognition particle subunit SRP54